MVNVDHSLLNDIRSRLGNFPKQAEAVTVRSINRAVTNISSNVAKEIRPRYNIKAGDVKETLSKTRASKSSMAAVVRSKGNLIPLDRFKVTPRTIQPKRKKPIKIAVRKNGAKSGGRAFVADINGIKVFKRVNKRRLPIKRLFGPSIPQMLDNEEIREKINQEGFDTFNRRLDHDINRILSRGNSA